MTQFPAGSLMFGTPINLVQELIVLGLILGSVPNVSSFLSRPWPFERPMNNYGQIRSLIRPSLISLWTRIIGVPAIRHPSSDFVHLFLSNLHSYP